MSLLLALARGFQGAILRLLGFKSRRITTSHGEMHVFDYVGRAEGPPLVLLHGIGAAASQLAPVLRLLRRNNSRVIAPDLAGHGFSDTPEGGINRETALAALVETLDQVVEEPFVLFGNSLGGLAAVRYAHLRREKVVGLCLCSPGGAPAEEVDFQAFLNNFRIRDLRSAAAFMGKLTARPLAVRWFAAPIVKALFNQPQMASLLRDTTSADLLDPQEVRSLMMPVHLIWGKSDHLMPREDLAFFKAELPEHATVEEPEDFGHCPYLDTPARLESMITGFAHRLSAIAP